MGSDNKENKDIDKSNSSPQEQDRREHGGPLPGHEQQSFPNPSSHPKDRHKNYSDIQSDTISQTVLVNSDTNNDTVEERNLLSQSETAATIEKAEASDPSLVKTEKPEDKGNKQTNLNKDSILTSDDKTSLHTPPLVPLTRQSGPFIRMANWLANSRIFALFVIIIVSLSCILPGQMLLPPFDRDEARFVQATKQMIETGDYVDIRFQEKPRYQKPIGIYWFQAAAVHLSGKGSDAPIWVYRLPSILAMVLTAIFTWWAAFAFIRPRAALLAGLMVATAFGLSIEAHQAKSDSILIMLITMAIAILAHIFTTNKEAPRGWLKPMIFWTALALSILVKGPIGPMVVICVILGSSLLTNQFAWISRLRIGAGFLWMALLVLPWFIAIWIKSDGAFFAHSLGKDLIGKAVGIQESHGGFPGYYTALLFLTFWPAVPFLMMGVPRIIRQIRAPVTIFCLSWIVPAWLLFEFMPTKLPHYVYPLYPALAILSAKALDDGFPITKWRKGIGLLIPLVALAFALAVPLSAASSAYWPHLNVDLSAIPPLGSILVLLGLLCAIISWRALNKNRLLASFCLASLTAIVIYWAVGQFTLPRLTSLWLSSRLAEAVNMASCPDPLLASAGYGEPSLVFLTRSDIYLTNGLEAAKFLAGEGCRMVFVEAKQEDSFLEALMDETPRLVGRIQGFNYSKGDQLDIALYIKDAHNTNDGQ